MALDCATVSALCGELSETLRDGRIEKIENENGDVVNLTWNGNDVSVVNFGYIESEQYTYDNKHNYLPFAYVLFTFATEPRNGAFRLSSHNITNIHFIENEIEDINYQYDYIDDYPVAMYINNSLNSKLFYTDGTGPAIK